VNQYAATNDPETVTVTNPLLPDDARTTPVVLQPGEHPFPTKYAIERTEIRIEPSIYLDALMQDVMAFGGRIRVRRFESAAELMALEEHVIVNCTGLGAKALFGDEELIPFRGQLVVLTPQDEVTYSTNGGLPVASGDPGFIHMMPRHDGIILGGTLEPDVWTLEVDETERMRVMDAHMRFFAAIRA
jgi:glycine/D-amino acid oxidase-like deaminating enzyme